MTPHLPGCLWPLGPCVCDPIIAWVPGYLREPAPAVDVEDQADDQVHPFTD